MARSKKPSISRPAKDAPVPYTEHLKKIYEFANLERTVRSGGVSETLTNADIMLRKQFEAGVSGKTLAQRDYLEQYQLAEESRRTYIKEQCEYWSAVKSGHQGIIDQARAAKVAIPRVLPHPDDITIDWSEGVRLPGPIDDEEWKKFDQTVRMQDALFLQQAMEDCLNGVRLGDRPTIGPAGLLGFHFNQLLPPSLRLSDFAWMDRVERLSRRSKRDALRLSRAAWWALGIRVARGKQFGTREKALAMLDTLFALISAGQRMKSDPLGYEEALNTVVMATEEFRLSARKLGPARSDVLDDREVFA